MNTEQLAQENKIFETVTGSHAYGMAGPDSDLDVRGIFVAEPINILTPFYPVEQVTVSPVYKDYCSYELNKFMKLLVDQNPNILELLWVDKADILFEDEFGYYEHIRANRENLLSSKCKHTFSGYAHSQLQRIKGHNKWITNPQPEEPPQQIDFLRTIHMRTWSLRQPRESWRIYRGNGQAILRVYGHLYVMVPAVGERAFTERGELIVQKDEEKIQKLKKEQVMYSFMFEHEEYTAAKKKHEEYWTWKKNRNEKRSELEEKFGYDTKHASHLIRLLRMGKEILEGKGVIVKRPDAQSLLDIRNGKFDYEEILEEAEILVEEIEIAHAHTDLPRSVDQSLAANIIMDIRNLSD